MALDFSWRTRAAIISSIGLRVSGVARGLAPICELPIPRLQSCALIALVDIDSLGGVDEVDASKSLDLGKIYLVSQWIDLTP